MHIELFRERILIEFYRNRIQPLKVKASKDATDKKQKTKFSIASLTGARIKLNFSAHGETKFLRILRKQNL